MANTAIQNLLNVAKHASSHGTESLLDAISIEHRTNQQLIAGVVFALIKQWSNDYENKNFDLRNEATVTTSNTIVEKLGEDFPANRLPYI